MIAVTHFGAGPALYLGYFVVQVTFIALIVIFWGVLGADARYIIVVAVMAWGFGDAAAALVGKAIGRRSIRHGWIRGLKTVEGTMTMLVVAGAALFLTLVVYAGHSLSFSLTVAVLVAPVCAAVELFSDGGTDTLTVPISAGVAILIVMTLLSRLSV